ncbi:NUDIX domain-containing protein [Pseudotabrizicola sp. L79]|uniref:NUDIX domain-containing protein n=1 Tax=Pseudotabrizicola sp. L79 TaxID=3118402 RepID=UPI002F92D02A
MTQDIFLYGILCHPPLLQLVLGRSVAGEMAHLPGWRAVLGQGHHSPALVVAPLAQVQGTVLRGLTPSEQDRLDFFAACLGLKRVEREVVTDRGAIRTQLFCPVAEGKGPAAQWSLTDWAKQHGAEMTAAAADMLRLIGEVPATAINARLNLMLVRAGGRVRAMHDACPATVRRQVVPGDIVIDRFQQPYAHFFAVEEYDLRFRRFDGSLSPPVNRATFISGDAVTVLPYDARRDHVLLVEQFRAAPFARGDQNPWSLEAIAGRIDAGESAEDCARREAQEEAGLTLQTLLPIANYYPSPGAKTEFLYSFLALTDLPEGVQGVFGMGEEAEDIRGHLIPFARMMQLVSSGEIANGPLVLTALWLQRERPRLRAEAGAQGL